MTEIGPRVAPADGTTTRFVERTRVVHPLRVLDVQLAARCESLPGAAVSRWQNTVKHVDATRHSFNQILRRSDAHQVSRGVFRHLGRDVLDDFKHQRLLFTDAQTTDSVAVKADVYGLFETDSSQVQMPGS